MGVAWLVVTGAAVVLSANNLGSGLPAAASATSNLLVGDQSTFTRSTGGWSGVQATLAWASQVGESAPGSLEVLAASGSPASAWSGSPAAGGLVAAQPGGVYRGTAVLENAGPAGSPTTANLAVAFYDTAGHTVGYVESQPSSVPGGGWVQAPVVAAVAPATASYAALGVQLASSAAGQGVYLDDATLTGTGAAPAVVGPLRASGTSLLDGDNHPVTLRGMELDGLEWSSSASGVTQSAVAAIRSWGANAVRIPLGSQLWLSGSCHFDASYASAVDNVVQWVTSAGMVAILTLDFSEPGTCAHPNGQVMADAPGSETFWSQVAARYASNPLVVFDLYNEPHDITDAAWLSGGPVQDKSSGASFTAAGMQQLYDAVRQAGAGNLVLVSGNNWGNTPPSTLVSGSNIAYAVHAYTCPHAPPPSNTCANNPMDPGQILRQWVPFQQSHPVPVVVSEFGWPAQTDGTYNATVVSFAETQGWSWSAFAFSTQAPWGLTVSGPGGAPEPTASGLPPLATMAATQGTSLPTPGYWMAAADGGVFAFNAPFYGSMGGTPLTKPIVGMTSTADQLGYWLVAADGGIFAFGDAAFYGSMGGTRLVEPVVGMARDPATGGYWLVAADGGIFAFNAPFYGSMGGAPLAQPVVGMASTSDGGGYWLVARDGGVFAFGDAAAQGSAAGHAAAPVVPSLAPTFDNGGYCLSTTAGTVSCFGDAPVLGSGAPSAGQVAWMMGVPGGGGYYLVGPDGSVQGFGDAPVVGSLSGVPLAQPVVAAAVFR